MAGLPEAEPYRLYSDFFPESNPPLSAALLGPAAGRPTPTASKTAQRPSDSVTRATVYSLPNKRKSHRSPAQMS